MRIGIDLDDTLANFSEVFIEYAIVYNKKIKKDISETLYDSTSFILNWSIEERETFFKLYIEDIAGSLKTFDNAKEIIQKLKVDGHEIYIISARNTKLYKSPYSLTSFWLKNKGIPFDKLIVDTIEKKQECIDNNIDIYVDDNIEIAEDISKYGIKTILMTNNLNFNKETKIKRAQDWNSLYEMIKS